MYITLWFAVNREKRFIYLDERSVKEKSAKISSLLACSDNIERDFQWNDSKPSNAGMYRALIKCTKTEDKKYILRVLHCSPVAIISNRKNDVRDFG